MPRHGRIGHLILLLWLLRWLAVHWRLCLLLRGLSIHRRLSHWRLSHDRGLALRRHRRLLAPHGLGRLSVHRLGLAVHRLLRHHWLLHHRLPVHRLLHHGLSVHRLRCHHHRLWRHHHWLAAHHHVTSHHSGRTHVAHHGLGSLCHARLPHALQADLAAISALVLHREPFFDATVYAES